MANGPTAGSIDEYIAGFPPDTQKALEEVRALIRAVAPAATETISYAIPAFDLHGTLDATSRASRASRSGFYPTGERDRGVRG